MNASSLLEWCRDRDVRLTSVGEKLRWSAPKGVISQRVLQQLQDHKQDLLEALNDRAGSKTLSIRQPAIVRTGPDWVRGDQLANLPEIIQGLVCEREGWRPGSWATYLGYKAERCHELHPDLAEKYEFAASLLRKGED